jgi:hypothetical protein
MRPGGDRPPRGKSDEPKCGGSQESDEGVNVMQMRRTCLGAVCLGVVLVIAAAPGCRKEETPEAKSPAVAAQPAADTAIPAELEAKLAKADQLDGEADKVIKRCASCSFSMDGSSEHTLKAMDYTMYFCTEACANKFAENMTESIRTMTVPDE